MNPRVEKFEGLLFVPEVEDKEISKITKIKRYSTKKRRLGHSTDISRVQDQAESRDRKTKLARKANLRVKKSVVTLFKGMKEVAGARDAQYFDHFGTPDVDYVVYVNGSINQELFVHVVKNRAERQAYMEQLLAGESETISNPFEYLLQRQIVILLGTSELRIKEKLQHIVQLLTAKNLIDDTQSVRTL